MKRLVTTLMVTLVIVSNAGTCLAAERFALDEEQTFIGFSVSYMFVKRVRGQFNDFRGFFEIDDQQPENNRAEIIIDTASVDTGFPARDAQIRGADLFNVEHYPTMAFHSDKIEMGADNRGQIIGDLTLLGISKSVKFDLVKEKGEDEGLINGFKVSGKIKRSDFGMNAFMKPIGNKVTLLFCYNVAECNDDNIYQEKSKVGYNQ